MKTIIHTDCWTYRYIPWRVSLVYYNTLTIIGQICYIITFRNVLIRFLQAYAESLSILTCIPFHNNNNNNNNNNTLLADVHCIPISVANNVC